MGLRIEKLLLALAFVAALVGTLPVLPYLDLWVALLLGAATLSGLIGLQHPRVLLGGRTAVVLALAVVSPLILQLSPARIVLPLTQILVVLLAVRLATPKQPRQILQIFLLSVMILAASTLLTLNMIYLVYLVALVVLVSTGLVLLCLTNAVPDMRLHLSQLKLLGRVVALLPVGSLLLMLVLFFILPRTQLPLWNFLNPLPRASTGMAEQMRPGTVTELARSGEIAFRAEMMQWSEADLYWRAIVLDHFDGRTWTRRPGERRETLDGPATSTAVTIYPQAGGGRYLATLEATLEIEGIRHRSAGDGIFVRRSPAEGSFRYRAQVSQDGQRRLRGTADHYLQLPEGTGQRLVELAHRLKRPGSSRAQRIAALEEYYRARQLEYAADALPLSDQPFATFLFESRRGYCEYFAGSFAVLLRLLEVPSRVVGGYLGGRYSDLGGYYQVSEDLAHVWVEALDDQGRWRRIDPSRFAINAGEQLTSARSSGLPIGTRIADALFHAWSRSVLNYDFRRQLELLRATLRRAGDWSPERVSVTGEVFWWVMPGLGAVLPFWWLRRQRPAQLVARYRRRVAGCCGLRRLPPSLGLYDLAARCGEPLCAEFARIYGPTVYAGESLSRNDIARLRRIIKLLKGRKLNL